MARSFFEDSVTKEEGVEIIGESERKEATKEVSKMMKFDPWTLTTSNIRKLEGPRTEQKEMLGKQDE
jgi:hypothetical protein